jgi:hypothetical protein
MTIGAEINAAMAMVPKTDNVRLAALAIRVFCEAAISSGDVINDTKYPTQTVALSDSHKVGDLYPVIISITAKRSLNPQYCNVFPWFLFVLFM